MRKVLQGEPVDDITMGTSNMKVFLTIRDIAVSRGHHVEVIVVAGHYVTGRAWDYIASEYYVRAKRTMPRGMPSPLIPF